MKTILEFKRYKYLPYDNSNYAIQVSYDLFDAISAWLSGYAYTAQLSEDSLGRSRLEITRAGDTQILYPTDYLNIHPITCPNATDYGIELCDQDVFIKYYKLLDEPPMRVSVEVKDKIVSEVKKSKKNNIIDKDALDEDAKLVLSVITETACFIARQLEEKNVVVDGKLSTALENLKRWGLF
jgi:hypothetical protein